MGGRAGHRGPGAGGGGAGGRKDPRRRRHRPRGGLHRAADSGRCRVHRRARAADPPPARGGRGGGGGAGSARVPHRHRSDSTTPALPRADGGGGVSDLLARLDEAAAAVRAQAPGFVADVGMVLGSGLSGAVRLLETPHSLPLAALPHVRAPTVSGHPGRLVLGTVGRLRVAALAGRLHPYEGWTAEETVFPVRLLIHLGAPVLVLTNAAGAVRPDLRRGDWMSVRDHLNLSGLNPLRGPNDVRVGPRFPDLSAAYDPGLRALLAGAAVEAGVGLAEGVYAMMGGPSYETPAEIQML